MTAQWLLTWWNLIFVVPFGIALLYLGVYTLSGWTFGEADADVDHDVDADVDHDFDADADAGADVEHDVDADADADVDHDVDADADADADADTDTDTDADHDADSDTDTDTGADEASSTSAPAGGSSSATWSALTWLGVGRVPVSLLLMVMFISFGLIGFLINQSLREPWHESWRIAGVSIPLAILGTMLITRTVARLLGTYMPTRETYARRQHELLGSVGEAVYAIDETFGLVAVRDDRGQLFQVHGRAPRGTTIDKGRRVRLVGFSSKERMFQVIPAAAEPSTSAPPTAAQLAHAATKTRGGGGDDGVATNNKRGMS
jgi:hypothetical protein